MMTSIEAVNTMRQEHLAPLGLDALYIPPVQINEWVRAARTAAGLTQEQLGNELGVTKGNVSGWENGRHEPSYSQLLKIEMLTGYALSRSAAAVDGVLLIGSRHQVMEPPAPFPSMEPILAWQHEDELPAGEFVLVPRLDVHLSAGHGAGSSQVEIQFDEAQPQAFRAEWIRQQHLKPRKLAAMTARGNSMEPTIHDGDSLLVDTSQVEVIDGKVYALWYEGGERVKRLYRMPGGGLRIRSDNDREHPEILLGADYTGHVRVIGRVVHRSGTGGL
jgi:phage repressor protein C with HTH and peptisase S24 domain